jgi:outer membrane autotransporter protein
MIRSGSFDGRGGSGIGFESDGLSAGVDVDLTHAFTLGAGLGYGRDDNTIAGGSRLKGSARAFVGYASYHPWSHLFLDGMLGYQQLDYDTTRQLTGTDGVVRGNRDGSQWFASLSMGADVQHGALQVTPYARVDLARGSLDGYTETGDPYLALRYEAMDIDSSTGNLGLRLAFRNHTGWGWFEPQLRLEYQRQFDGAESGRVRYADLANGPFYTLAPSDIDRNRLMLGLGATLDSNSGWSTHVEYQTQTGGQRDEGVQLNVQKDF